MSHALCMLADFMMCFGRSFRPALVTPYSECTAALQHCSTAAYMRWHTARSRGRGGGKLNFYKN